MLNEITKAVEEFDTVSDNKLGYCGEKMLGFAFYADGEIRIENNYRSDLAATIKRRFVDQWCQKLFSPDQKML